MKLEKANALKAAATKATSHVNHRGASRLKPSLRHQEGMQEEASPTAATQSRAPIDSSLLCLAATLSTHLQAYETHLKSRCAAQDRQWALVPLFSNQRHPRPLQLWHTPSLVGPIL